MLLLSIIALVTASKLPGSRSDAVFNEIATSGGVWGTFLTEARSQRTGTSQNCVDQDLCIPMKGMDLHPDGLYLSGKNIVPFPETVHAKEDPLIGRKSLQFSFGDYLAVITGYGKKTFCPCTLEVEGLTSKNVPFEFEVDLCHDNEDCDGTIVFPEFAKDHDRAFVRQKEDEQKTKEEETGDIWQFKYSHPEIDFELAKKLNMQKRVQRVESERRRLYLSQNQARTNEGIYKSPKSDVQICKEGDHYQTGFLGGSITYYSIQDSNCNQVRRCSESGKEGLLYHACPTQVYVPMAGYHRVKCDADNTWYSNNDPVCNEVHSCASNGGLYYNACPIGKDNWTDFMSITFGANNADVAWTDSHGNQIVQRMNQLLQLSGIQYRIAKKAAVQYNVEQGTSDTLYGCKQFKNAMSSKPSKKADLYYCFVANSQMGNLNGVMSTYHRVGALAVSRLPNYGLTSLHEISHFLGASHNIDGIANNYAHPSLKCNDYFTNTFYYGVMNNQNNRRFCMDPTNIANMKLSQSYALGRCTGGCRRKLLGVSTGKLMD